MNIKLYPKSRRARQAINLFPHQFYNDAKAVKSLRTNWLKSIKVLGDRWLMSDANQVQRKTVLSHV